MQPAPSRSPRRWTLDCHTCSEPAPESAVNEDFAVADPVKGVFVVADGMGGRPAGHLASRIAASAFVKSLLRDAGGRPPRRSILVQAVADANTAVRACGRRNASRTGLGTTLTAVVLRGRTGRIVHLGDSRAYLYHQGRLRQLTDDHTLAEELLRRRCVDREQLARHPFRHVLLRTIGTHQAPDPDILAFSLEPGDGLILTTDEIPRLLPNGELEAIARRHWARGAAAVCGQLMRRARQRKPQDDVTLLVLKEANGEQRHRLRV
ncbi:MAG TPA: protein phosphatase 2C domain-containing protein [Verrucomicrobiota bacterium]|nr:protein phosphatase 2C domain-containing protein [Verrucomicrobiota bacterium]HNU50832.1 protein phosphatase 2C domain-containing protein [Verrucomicrobiota bacterium]